MTDVGVCVSSGGITLEKWKEKGQKWLDFGLQLQQYQSQVKDSESALAFSFIEVSGC